MNYPYYVIPDIEAFPTATGEERERLAGRIAALVADRDALCEILGLEPECADTSGNKTANHGLSTVDTIDSFLDRFGGNTREPLLDAEAEVPLPPPEYDLSRIETAPIIIPRKTAPEKLTQPQSAEEKTDPSPESLARMAIKNGDYVKALEIITDLSLNNPKKSIYFADQIRFLKKLILNQSKSTKA